ncbi:MAG: urease accessory protein UreD [Rhodospirillales bacterium]|nr:MAG: urease accessory protein UreD [Rhodospirillales bacterium]TVR97374.1 MAG: urease accessory protein UreD [Rhodospirillales bacterium]
MTTWCWTGGRWWRPGARLIWWKPMSVVISQSDAETGIVAAPGGALRLGFRQRGQVTELADLLQRAPLRALFPRSHEPEAPVAVIVNTGGGLVGGDRVDVHVHLEKGATALVTGQAAEKVYRSTGTPCRLSITLSVAAGAWLEWLPQETILFNGARLERTTTVAADPAARVMAGDILVFGRTARGEGLTHGRLRDAWDVRVDGWLMFADALELDEDLAALLADPACLDGAVAAATLLYVAPDADRHLARARRLMHPHLGAGLRGGATVVGGILLMRWLGRDAMMLRQSFGLVWAAFRSQVGGREAALPRLWSV